MDGLMKSMMTRRAWFLVPGILGDVCLIVGIITAAMNVTFSGFAPIIWVLLAVALYLYMICIIALQILGRLEAKA